MDKEKIRTFAKEKKLLLLAVVGGAVVLILLLCIWGVLRDRAHSAENVNSEVWISAEELRKSGLEFLPEDPEQIQAVADMASGILSELSEAGSDRETVIQTLRDTILGLGYGITEEEAQELSQWLVDYYLKKQETIQNSSQTTAGEDSSSFEQLQTDLQAMAEYLEKLDVSVTYNREELQNLITVQGGSLETIQKYLDHLKEEISVLKEELSGCENTGSLEETVNTGINSISLLLGTLYENIADTQNEILVKLVDSSLNTNEKYEEIQARLGDLTVSINQNLEELDDHLSGVLDDLMADHDEQSRELIQKLQAMQEQVTALLEESAQENALQFTQMEENSRARHEALIQKLTETYRSITAALEEMRTEDNTQNTVLVEQLQRMQAELDAVLGQISADNEGYYTSLTERLTKLHSGLNSTLEAMKTESAEQNTAQQELILSSADGIRSVLEMLEQSGEEWHRETNFNINTKAAELMNNLNGIHTYITSTQQEIRQILEDIQTADTQRMSEILEEFRGITADLAAIHTSMDTAHGEIKTLITEVEANLKKEADANQSELLGALTEMDHSFEQANSEGFQGLLDSLQVQAENMQNQFDALNSSMTANTSTINQTAENNKTEVLNKLVSMESSISSTLQGISTGTGVSQEAILKRIGQLEENTNNHLSGISGDIQSVFQRVSNGKALLASALLTKDAVIDEDATFQEIHDAILGIKQEIVIGVDKLPGIIEYEYHHHTGDSKNGGGCYTVEDVHQHVGSCYVVCRVDESGCHSDGNYNVNGMMHCPKTVSHSYCWNGETRWSEWVHPDDGNSHVDGNRHSEHLVTVCGKNAGQSYGWKTGCGLQDGQITGAHIIYDADAVSAAAAEYRKEAADENAAAMEKLEELLEALEQGNAVGGTSVPEKDSGVTEQVEKETESQTETEVETQVEETEEEALTEDETVVEDETVTEGETSTEGEAESEAVQETEGDTGAVEESESGTEGEKEDDVGEAGETEEGETKEQSEEEETKE